MLSAGVTKVSKKRHVRRAIRRRLARLGSAIAKCRATVGERLDHSASAGAATHNNAKGSASGQDDGMTATAPAARMAPSAVPPAMLR
jgi:hypothetical protein